MNNLRCSATVFFMDWLIMWDSPSDRINIAIQFGISVDKLNYINISWSHEATAATFVNGRSNLYTKKSVLQPIAIASAEEKSHKLRIRIWERLDVWEFRNLFPFGNRIALKYISLWKHISYAKLNWRGLLIPTIIWRNTVRKILNSRLSIILHFNSNYMVKKMKKLIYFLQI
jgi:hypothetical protein